MKKTIVALVFACSIAGAHINAASAGVIDECPFKGGESWKCDAKEAKYFSGISWSPSDIWSVLYRTYFMY